MKLILSLICILSTCIINAQTETLYEITFENAPHHEMQIEATFKGISGDTAIFRMARSSPGRYAIHEFVKNVYSVEVTNLDGQKLSYFRPDPYSWGVVGHKGAIRVSYTLFANRADGTYSQVDETHAHLNMPATFMYMPELSEHPFTVNFKPRVDINWKVATQLKEIGEDKFTAPNLQYFMDSPTEISDFKKRSFEISGSHGKQQINLVLHDDKSSQEEIDAYIEKIEKVVKAQQQIMGELPKFDFGEYTFLACYMPQVNGDGMEHRNSTVVTTTRSLSEGGLEENIGTISHEFFHCWNVERIRPKSLEPFNFEEANMSGALWFAEGFTNYFDGLALTRAGIWDFDKFLEAETNTYNYVWTSPGINYFNPIEMSMQAPFVDAATSLDPTNRENTYISYYSYGEMLGFALDLKLREIGKSLDGLMQAVWMKYGQTEIPYTVADLENALGSYASKSFAADFFNNYIYDSKIPNYKELLQLVGIDLIKKDELSWGANVRSGKVMSNPYENSTAYETGLQYGDTIIKIDATPITSGDNLDEIIRNLDINTKHTIVVKRFGESIEKPLKLKTWPKYNLVPIEDSKLTDKQRKFQKLWLEP